MKEEIVIPDNVSIFDFLDTDDSGYDHGEPENQPNNTNEGVVDDE